MPDEENEGTSKLAQIPAHSPHDTANQDESRNEASPENPAIVEAWGSIQTPQMGDTGFEPVTSTV